MTPVKILATTVSLDSGTTGFIDQLKGWRNRDSG